LRYSEREKERKREGRKRKGERKREKRDGNILWIYFHDTQGPDWEKGFTSLANINFAGS